MIEQLVRSLRALASSADARRAPAQLPEHASAYFDALLLALDCPQVRLEPAQRSALIRLEEHLDAIAKARGEVGESGDTRRTSELAASALRALGHDAHAE